MKTTFVPGDFNPEDPKPSEREDGLIFDNGTPYTVEDEAALMDTDDLWMP